MDDTLLEEFGIYLKELREHKALTLSQLAEKIGYSDAYISQIEKGRRKNPPTLELLESLSKGLDVPYSSLLRGAGYEGLAEGQRLKEAFDDIENTDSFTLNNADTAFFLDELLEIVRKESNLTTQELADRSGVDLQVLQQIENKDDKNIGVDTLVKLSMPFLHKYPLIFLDFLYTSRLVSSVDVLQLRSNMMFPRMFYSGRVEESSIGIKTAVTQDNLYDLRRVLKQINTPVSFYDETLNSKEKDLLYGFVELLIKHRENDDN